MWDKLLYTYCVFCVLSAGRESAGRRSWGTIVLSRERTERNDFYKVGVRPALGRKGERKSFGITYFLANLDINFRKTGGGGGVDSKTEDK